MQEIIREHPTLKGLLISNLGKVFIPQTNRYKAHWTEGYDNDSGYKMIKYQQKFYRVHRLVAETFLPNPNNFPTVDHIDRNKANNRVDNLRWADMKMQIANRDIDYKAFAEIFLNRKDLSKKVLQYTKEGEFIKEWESTMECHRNGFNNGAVGACCRGKLPHYKNFIWKYKETT